MTLIRSQQSVRHFYTAAVAAGADTPEALNAAVSPRCRALIDRARSLGLSCGLDLGYGMGNHTLAMLEAGLRVVTVDQVPPQHLVAAVAERGLDAERVAIHQGRLEAFVPAEAVGLVIAKDVLHYLSQDHIERLLQALIDHTVCGGLHHLEVFCDIWRITGERTPVAIEGEADYGALEFIDFIRRRYARWELDIAQEPHVERDTRSDKPYFTATRVIVTAHQPAGTAPEEQRSTT